MKVSGYISSRVFPHVALALLLLMPGVSSHSQERPPLDQVVEQFLDPDTFFEQRNIALEIISYNDTSVLSGLQPLLSHENRYFRGNTALIFAALGDERGITTLRDILHDYSYRPDLGMSLGTSPELQVRADRYYATTLFGVLKDARAVPILIDVLDDRDVNYGALWALGQIGDKRAAGPMMSKLDDSDPSIRVYAIDALAQLKSKEALPRLRELLDDHESSHSGNLRTVAEAAATAISQLEAEP